MDWNLKLIEFNDDVPADTKDEFKRLTEQYENLPEAQKQALITYKSFLFLFMSRIMQIKDYDKIDIEKLYEELSHHEKFNELQILLEREFNKRVTGKNMASNPTTSFIEPALSIYKTNPDVALRTLIEALVPICKNLEQTFGSMVLEKDIEVYRGTKGEEAQGKVSASPIVSTTLFKDIAFGFIDDDDRSNGYNLGNIYKLKIKRGTPVLVCPVGFRIGLQENSNQYEVMFLNKNVEAIIGNAERQKTFFSVGDNPLTVDCINGIIYPNDLIFTEDEVQEDIEKMMPETSPEQLQEQIYNIVKTKDSVIEWTEQPSIIEQNTETKTIKTR